MTDIVVIEEQGTTVVEVTSPGPQGASGVMRVGSVTTGPAGSQANVTNSGTTTDAVFNFTIPRGDVGDVTPEATAAKNTAEAAAAAALASQNAASGSAAAAATSQSNAAGSATSASASAATATTKASEASTSAAAAAASQSSATDSATLATNKAAEAASSATAAATSSSDATQSANAAVGFANAASASSSAASASATSSAGSASKAQEWATKTTSEVETGQGFGAKKYAQDASALANSAEIAAAGSLAHSQTSALHALEASNSADNANASAVAATISSNSAASSASAATSQAATATTQAGNAAASAATATTQASSAAASASTASTQAGIATTKASEAATSASAASVSAAAALASQTASAGSAAAANTSAGSAAGSAANALAIYGTTNAQQAALMAAQSAASLAQGFALSASSAIQQDLSGVTAQALHRSPNAVTAMFVYDTSKDSDGGAWTEKCQHTSWYNEALNGKWLGAWSTEGNARLLGAAALGPELIGEGSFQGVSTDWAPVNGAILSTVNGRLRVTSTGTWYTGATKAIPTVIGKTYKVVGGIYPGTSNASFSKLLTATNRDEPTRVDFAFNTSSANQELAGSFVATSTTSYIWCWLYGNTSGTFAEFDNISVREVTALNTASGDYYQSTVDGRFYRLRKNLAFNTHNFSGWGNQGSVATLTATAGAGPTGGTAYKLVPPASASTTGHIGTGNFANGAAAGGTRYTFSIKAKAGEYPRIGVRGMYNAATGYQFHGTIDLTTGLAVSNVGLYPVTATPDPRGNGYYIIKVEGLVANNGGNLDVTLEAKNATSTAQQNFSADGVSGIYITEPQYETGVVTTAYEENATSTYQVETFRGNKADFPRLAGIVAEAANVTIYDLTEAGRPMWMRFATNGSWNYINGVSLSGLAAANGLLSVTHTGNGGCLSLLSFAADTVRYFRQANNYNVAPRAINIASRQLTTAPNAVSEVPPTLNNAVGNAVAMTVLPDAPVDAVTGLQVPTIAVATAGGVSRIAHDGTVSSTTTSATVPVKSVWYKDNYLFAHAVYISGGTEICGVPANATLSGSGSWLGASWASIPRSVLFTRDSDGTRIPALWQGGGKFADSGTNYRIRFGNAVAGIKPNYANATKTAVSNITNTFNTGHLIGDIRRAYLADVDVGSVSGTELVVNGAFDTDVSGWANVTWNNGVGRVTNTGTWVYGTQNVATEPGKTYCITADCVAASGVTGVAVEGNGYTNTFPYYTASVGSKIRCYFLATSSTSVVRFASPQNTNGSYFEIDNVSVKACSADRSYKSANATITGTLTKTQVAEASQLVAYSGFSAANYLREPYSADLDFGTGEWSCGAWVNYKDTVKNIFSNSNPTWNGAGTSSFVTYDGYASVTSVTLGAASNTRYGRFESSANVISDRYTVGFLAALSRPLGAGERIYIAMDGGQYQGNQGIDITNVGTLQQYSFAFNATATNGTLPYIQASTLFSELTVYFTRPQGNPGVTLLPFVQAAGAPAYTVNTIADRSHASGPRITLSEFQNKLTATAFDGTTTRTVTTTAAYNTATWLKVEAYYNAYGTLTIAVNGVDVAVTRGTPLLSLNSRYNLLTYTEDFANAAWTKTGVTVTANAGIAPDGTITSDALLCSGNSNHQFIGALATSGSSVISIYVKPSVSPCFYIGSFSHGGTVYFDLVNKTVSSLVSPAINASIVDSDNGFVICKVTLSAVSNYLHLGFLDAVYTGTSTSPWAITTQATEGFIWGVSAVPVALAALPYQRVGASLAETQIAPLTIGNSFAADAPFPGSIALLKLSATVPTAEQSQWMYEQEKQMFRNGAQVTLPDAGSIVDLTYDDATDKWIAVSATNESEWSGLVRTSVTPSPAGSYTKVSAASGVQLQARSTTNPGVDITIPSYGLREELVRRSESAARLARTITVLDYAGGFTANTTLDTASVTGVAGLLYPASYIGARVTGANIQADTFVVGIVGTTMYLTKTATSTVANAQLSFSDFVLPLGYEAKAVLVAGAAKQEGSTKDFTRLFDGFKETIRFGTSPAYNAFVQIQATRTVA